jgi:hypothetical protein
MPLEKLVVEAVRAQTQPGARRQWIGLNVVGARRKAISAMAATRATGTATPVSSSPNNNRPTSKGTISKANPVTASPTAAKISAFFIDLAAQRSSLKVSLLICR